MGSGQSARATHFQNPGPGEDSEDYEVDDHHISISNKMVERLVEDATLAGGAEAAAGTTGIPRGDFKEKMYMEKIKFLDENHSERSGLTMDNLKATLARIELRTANMVSPEPVCEECKDQVIQCYHASDTPADVVKCWNTVGAFSKCVQEAASTRLQARTLREARDSARRERHVAHARAHTLRDLATHDTPIHT